MPPNQSSAYLDGDRRMGRDRREFSYACCIPERRSGLERRSGKDRRQPDRVFSMIVSALSSGENDSRPSVRS